MVSIGDIMCPPEYSEFLYAEIKSEKYLRVESGTHLIFALQNNDNLVDRMARTIETGTYDGSSQGFITGALSFTLLISAVLL